MEIRVAKLGEFEQVLNIARQVHNDHVGYDNTLYADIINVVDIEAFQNDIKNENVFVVVELGVVVAYAITSFKMLDIKLYVKHSKLTVESLGVDENHRGKGYGKKLVAYLEDVARNRNCDRLELATHSKNTNAIALYEKCGMEIRSVIFTKSL